MGYAVVTKSGRTREVQDILRLSAGETAQVLRFLDEQSRSSVTNDRRRSPRRPYTAHRRLAVILENELKGRRTYALIPRNLSRTGISLLHGKFVYGQTRCVVGLTALDGQIVPVHGRVAWCRLVTGRVHEIGVAFDEAIDVDEFVD